MPVAIRHRSSGPMVCFMSTTVYASLALTCWRYPLSLLTWWGRCLRSPHPSSADNPSPGSSAGRLVPRLDVPTTACSEARQRFRLVRLLGARKSCWQILRWKSSGSNKPRCPPLVGNRITKNVFVVRYRRLNVTPAGPPTGFPARGCGDAIHYWRTDSRYGAQSAMGPIRETAPGQHPHPCAEGYSEYVKIVFVGNFR